MPGTRACAFHKVFNLILFKGHLYVVQRLEYVYKLGNGERVEVTAQPQSNIRTLKYSHHVTLFKSTNRVL